jgi:hypothetical protein
MFKSKRTIIREQNDMLDAQARQIQALQSKLSELEYEHSALKGDAEVMREREASVIRTLREATHAAVRIKDDAESEAEAVREKLRRDIDETKKETETLRDVAYQNARGIVQEAEEQNRLQMEHTKNTVRNYSMLLHQFHELMLQNAEQAKRQALEYAELTRRMQSELPPLPENELLALLEEGESRVPLCEEERVQISEFSPEIEEDDGSEETEDKVWKLDDISVDDVLNSGSDKELLDLIDSILQKSKE